MQTLTTILTHSGNAEQSITNWSETYQFLIVLKHLNAYLIVYCKHVTIINHTGGEFETSTLERYPYKTAKFELNFSECVASKLSDVDALSKLILIYITTMPGAVNIQQFVNRLTKNHCLLGDLSSFNH